MLLKQQRTMIWASLRNIRDARSEAKAQLESLRLEIEAELTSEIGEHLPDREALALAFRLHRGITELMAAAEEVYGIAGGT